MRILFNSSRYFPVKPKLEDEEAAREIRILDDSAYAISEALKSHIVWAKVEEGCGIGDEKFRVRDVRILEEPLFPQPDPDVFIVSERLQVKILEGWRTASLVWTDEIVAQEAAGVH